MDLGFMEIKRLILFSLGWLFVLPCLAWGFFGHEKINTYAIYTLPIDLRAFYLQNQSNIEYYATLPDKRRYAVANEGGRHFMDMEFYFERYGQDTLKIFDIAFYQLQSKFQDTIFETGYAYWNILQKYDQLIEAFKTQNQSQIVKLSGEIGHYIGDIHVPLHTTENYNGQLTNQHGIHALWETSLLKNQWEDLISYVPQAQYYPNVDEIIQQTILSSHSYVKTVLESDANARTKLNGKIYKGETHSYNNLDVHPKYVQMVKNVQLPILKERMLGSIHLTASIWYSAWIEAGKPILNQTPVAIEKEVLKDTMVNDQRVHIH